MKRDVKVGLFVAGVVCCVAALLLGGGVVGRSKAPPARLSLSPREDGPGVLPAELAEALLPPADAERLVEVIARLPLEDRAVADNVIDSVFASVFAIDAPDDPDDSEVLGMSPDDTRDEDLRGAAEDLDPEAEVAALARLLGVGLPAGGTTSGTTSGDDTGGGLAATDITEEDLLAREARELAADAPPRSARVAQNAADFGAGTPSLRIAPPARGIAVPARAKHVYIMKQGDSFWTVSKKIYNAGKYYNDILLANPDVEPKKLRPGDKIAIPEIPGVPMRKDLLADPRELERKRKPREYLARDKIHEVQPGETLQDIARTYYGYMHKWPHIVRANPDLDPRKIRPGDKIIVPALTE